MPRRQSRRLRLPTDTQAEIVRRYAAGDRMDDIMADCGVRTRQTVWRVVERHGLPRRPHGNRGVPWRETHTRGSAP